MFPPRHFIGVLALGLLLATFGGTVARWQAEPVRDAVAIAHPLFAFDPADERALAAYATDIFVGRVVSPTGDFGAPTSAPGQEVPQTQFAVEVTHALKGDASGMVTVSQVGGFDRQTGRTMLLAGDALLQPGTSELFLTVHVPERDWYQIAAAGHGHLAAHEPERLQAFIARFSRVLDDTSRHPRQVQVTSPSAASYAQAADEPVDFISFNGAVYLAATYLAENSPDTPFVPITAEDLGPVVVQVITSWVDADVAFAEPNEPCAWNVPDGTAPRLSPGDQIYAVAGYATTFLLAARHGDGYVAYQVWCSDDAEVGADLFDIYNRVARISVTADLSEASGWATIDDPAEVNRLIAMLLAGKVIPENATSTAPVTHQMILHLDDGSTFRASAAPGEFLWGLGAVEIPLAFTDELQRAWEQRDTGAFATPIDSDG